MNRSVLITGIGCINSLGNSQDQFFQQLNTVLQDQKLNELDWKKCQVRSYQFEDKELLKNSPRLDSSCKYLLGAVQEALQSAQIDFSEADHSRIAILIGSTYGMCDSQEKFLTYLYRVNRGMPTIFQQTTNNLLSGIIAYKYQVRGINMTLFNGWTSGLDAVVLGHLLIAANQADLVIAGGVDIINKTILTQYRNMQIIDGQLLETFKPGEGAGIVILEAEERAHGRDATIYGKLIKCGQGHYDNSSDLVKELTNLLEDEGTDVDLYLANQNGTILDHSENQALQNVELNSVLALKPVMGECGAATGVFQLMYGLQLGNQSSLIVNISLLGQYSYLKVDGMVKSNE